jgi:hypothetical protein
MAASAPLIQQNCCLCAAFAPEFRSKRRRVSCAVKSTPLPSREDLQQLTVKVLRDKLKLIQPPIKTSNLKLKSDMIDCLIQHYSNNYDANPVQTIQHNSTRLDTTRPRILKMPPISSKLLPDSSFIDDIPSKKNLSSPKDVIFDQVFNRYPPLRELHSLQANNLNDPPLLFSSFTHPSAVKGFSGLGELDIRQTYHPIFSNITSSDFDVVMVGTASCVPGVTRGVSCTALRLQWRRSINERSTNLGSDNKNYKQYMNTAGTWIFDCGESTQVRTILAFIYLLFSITYPWLGRLIRCWHQTERCISSLW